MARPKTFEEAMRRLEAIVDKLDEGEIPLEETVKLYREGLEKYEFCLQKLRQVEGDLKLTLIDPEAESTPEEPGEPSP